MIQPTTKLIYRKVGSKELEEIVLPPAIATEVIAKNAGISVSSDCGKTWTVFGGGNWDYFYEVGMHVPAKSVVSGHKVVAQANHAPKEQTTEQPAKFLERRTIPTETQKAMIWLSENLPESYSRKFNFPLKCARTGLDLGKFFPSSGLAVATPYVAAWKETTFLHPIFSLSLPALLHRANSCWTLEKTGTRTFPVLHKQLLFLAMLHASGCIKQDVAGLPNAKIVETHYTRVIEMLSWKHETASDRVHFPKLHVWGGADKEDRNNIFKQVPVWLDFCEIAKDEYENIVRERQKAAKAKAREIAMKSIRSAMYKDVSIKRLWNWIAAQVPQFVLENNPDFEQMFFTEESKIHAWTPEDLEALEDTFLKYCETGNSVSHEVTKRINSLKTFLATYKDTFEIVVDNTAYAAYLDTPKPMEKDFATRAAFLVASARWSLGNAQRPAAATTTKTTDKITGEDL